MLTKQKLLPLFCLGVLVVPPAFRKTVTHIIGRGSQEKMVGPYARAHVASVANDHPGRNGAVGNVPGESMRSPRLVIYVEPTVSARNAITDPQPTLSSFSNVLPKVSLSVFRHHCAVNIC